MQVLWQEELNYRALDQWTRELPIVAKRGVITDRNGVILADNDAAYTVFARSNAVKDKATTAKLLSQALAVNETTLYEKLTKKKASEITVAKKVGKTEIEALTSLALDGVYYSRDNVRTYPKTTRFAKWSGLRPRITSAQRVWRNITRNTSQGKTAKFCMKRT